MPRLQALRSWLHRLLGVVAALVLFTITFVGSLILHGDLPSSRRFVAHATTQLLNSIFEGEILVHEIKHIGFDGLDIQTLEARDPTGQRVLFVQGVHVRLPVTKALQKLALGGGAIALTIEDLHVDNAEVNIDLGPDGRHRIHATFTPRPSPPTPSQGPPRSLWIELVKIQIGHAWAHGAPAQGLPLQGEAVRIPGYLLLTEKDLAIDLERFALRSQLLAPLNPQGTADYHLRIGTDLIPRMWSNFHGRIGEITADASMKMEGLHLSATLDASRIEPAALRSIMPQAPLTESTSIHGKVEGTIPDLQGKIRILAGTSSEMNAEYELHLVDGFNANARWSVRHLDPRIFALGMPATSLGADGKVWARLNHTGFQADLEATTFPFLLGDQVLPGITTQMSYNGILLQGKATAHEPGVENTANFSIDKELNIQLQAEAKIEQIRNVTRLQGVADGSLQARLNAALSREGVLDAKVTGTFRDLRSGSVQASGGTIQSRLHGRLEQLTTETSLLIDSLDLSGFPMQRASLGATGPLLSPFVTLSLKGEHWEKLSLTGHAHINTRPSIDDIKVAFVGTKEKLKLEARVAQVIASSAGLDLRGLQLIGDAAQARGELNLRPSGFRLVIQEGRLDLPQLGRYFAPILKEDTLAHLNSGVLTFNGQIEDRNNHRSGNFQARILNLCSYESPTVFHGEAHLGLSGDMASSTFSAGLFHATCKDAPPPDSDTPPEEAIAGAKGQALGSIHGSLLDPQNWRRATGSIQLTELVANLDRLSGHPILEGLRKARENSPHQPPVPYLGGQIFSTLSLTRTDPKQPSSIKFGLVSQGFRMEIPYKDREPWKLEGMDLHTSLDLTPAIDLPGGIHGLWRAALLHDNHELFQLSAATSLLPTELYHALKALQDPSEHTKYQDAIAWLRSRPVSGAFLMQEQALETLPKQLQDVSIRGNLRGKIRAEAQFSGTADHPEITTRLDLRDLQRTFLDWDPWKLHISLGGTLGERGMALHGELGHHLESFPLPDGKISWQASSTKHLGDLLWNHETPWQASVEAQLTNWRLESIPLLASRGIQGSITGTVQALQMHDRPRIWIDLSLNDGKFSDAALAPSKLTASLVEGGGFITMAMKQPSPRAGEQGGEVALTILPTIVFKEKLFPTLDRRQRHPISLRFSRFDIEPLASITTPFLADLRGILDGEMTFTIGSTVVNNTFVGGLRWSRGVLLVPQLGQTFTQGQFNLTMASTPGSTETRVELRNGSLQATSGRIGAEAFLILPNDLLSRYLFPPEKGGIPFPTLRGGFTVDIAEQEKIPVTFEGLALGDAHGKSEGSLLLHKGEFRMDVAIPELTFDLPDTATQQILQDLSENPQIGVVVPAPRSRRRRTEAKAKPIQIQINVGLGTTLEDLLNDREPSGNILVRRASVDVRLAGVLRNTLAEDLTTTGTIETLSGRIVALGKPFDVRRGFVRFEGAVSNPYLNVGATWDSPDGTRIFADLQGYLKDAQFRLRSEPTRPESEVLSLVLFGRDSSKNAATNLGGPSDFDNNLAVGSGVASTLLNSFIDPIQVFGRRIETRVESTSNRGTSIGVAAELRPRLWAQVDVSTSSQRERQNSDLSAVTLDWRFRPNWSLRTTIGDRGSSLLELLWQFKY